MRLSAAPAQASAQTCRLHLGALVSAGCQRYHQNTGCALDMRAGQANRHAKHQQLSAPCCRQLTPARSGQPLHSRATHPVTIHHLISPWCLRVWVRCAPSLWFYYTEPKMAGWYNRLFSVAKAPSMLAKMRLEEFAVRMQRACPLPPVYYQARPAFCKSSICLPQQGSLSALRSSP